MALNIFNKLKKFFGSDLSNNNDDLDRSRKRSSDSPVTGASLVKYRMVNNTNSEFVSDTSDGIEQDLSTNTETVSPPPSSSFNHREKYAELLQTLAINCDTSRYAPPTSKNVNCSSQKGPLHSLCLERVNTTAHYDAPLSDCSVDLVEGNDECKVLTKSEQAVISQSNEIKDVDEICLNDNSSADEMELPKVTPVKSLMERFGLSCYLNKDWLKDFDITYWKKKDNEVKSTVEEKIVIDENKIFELNDQHHALIKRVLESPPDQVHINKFNLNVTTRDLRTLMTDRWVNDEVINFYMNLLMERSEKKNNVPVLKIYSMNTFFIPRLLKHGFIGVRRWTLKVDILEKDIIVVPVHVSGVHWCMAIIHLKNKSIKYYDSMGIPNPKVLSALEEYLKEESLDKKKIAFDTSGFVIESVKDAPRQMNSTDCGVFSCMFAEYITRDKAITFSQEHMEYFRQKMIVEIVGGELLQ